MHHLNSVKRFIDEHEDESYKIDESIQKKEINATIYINTKRPLGKIIVAKNGWFEVNLEIFLFEDIDPRFEIIMPVTRLHHLISGNMCTQIVARIIDR